MLNSEQMSNIIILETPGSYVNWDTCQEWNLSVAKAAEVIVCLSKSDVLEIKGRTLFSKIKVIIVKQKLINRLRVKAGTNKFVSCIEFWLQCSIEWQRTLTESLVKP